MRALFLPAILASTMLAGCNASQDAARELAAGQKITEAKRAELAALQRGGVINVDYPYYGKSVKVERLASKGKPLPDRVEGAKSVTLSSRASAKEFAAALEAQTQIPVIIQTQYTNLSGCPAPNLCAIFQ